MITIYSKENCPFCVQAAALCVAKGLEHEVLKLDVDYTKEQLVELCPVPVRSVPQIFMNGEHIGGFTELRAKLS